ncbi:alpha-amylase family glycosyl hydrolase [Hirschia maritima]|uniref:alpha-amylase family glycosyl hydrolase n=1 Tax=Hirschia maritima TaxID=1121961 RepID=UPI000374D22D|nr:alpha-amylase family glycosyl hydrolase [Hirschia maritima]
MLKGLYLRKALVAICAATALGCSADGAQSDKVQVESNTASKVDYTPKPYVQIEHPEWSRDAVLYQLNTRQFTQEGTFEAAQQQLPRLAELGVDIIWLMPIHPIGEAERKGTLGSPYAVKDYRAVNPDYGSVDDLRAFVAEAHSLGLHVILDWVANHSAWDNHLVEDHPEWYARDESGNLQPTPWVDWADIIDLDYSQKELREYMGGAMRYWVEDVGIDGFRADMAGMVPLDFWEDVRADLEKVKPVFMLAEYDQRDVLAKAFDASYSWAWKNTVQSVTLQGDDASSFMWYYFENEGIWPRDGYRLLYTSNHDQNSWDEAAPVLYGDAYRNVVVMSFVSEGIPMIYNGQEAYNEKMLEFFERDPIEWREHEISDLFKRLISLKKENTALHNGAAGARMIAISHDNPKQIFAFRRGDKNSNIISVFNMSSEAAVVSLTDESISGTFTDVFSGEEVEISSDTSWEMAAWSHKILVKN